MSDNDLKCKECHGTGRITLLTSVVVCMECNGTGIMDNKNKPENSEVDKNEEWLYGG